VLRRTSELGVAILVSPVPSIRAARIGHASSLREG
jgi:hypothetical protein